MRTEETPTLMDNPADGIDRTENMIHQAELQQSMAQPYDIANEAFMQYFPGSQFMKKVSAELRSIADNMSKSTDALATMITSGGRAALGFQTVQGLQAFADRGNHSTQARHVKLFTPPRLKGDWLTYTKFLVSLCEKVTLIDKEQLGPLAEYLARCINEPQAMASMSYKPKYVIRDVENDQKAVKKFFSASPREYVFWGEAFKRNSEVPQVLANLRKCDEILQRLPAETVAKSVKTVVERANILDKRLSGTAQNQPISPKQLEMMQDLFYASARVVEMYTVAVQLVTELENCISMTEAKFSASHD